MYTHTCSMQQFPLSPGSSWNSIKIKIDHIIYNQYTNLRTSTMKCSPPTITCSIHISFAVSQKELDQLKVAPTAVI